MNKKALRLLSQRLNPDIVDARDIERLCALETGFFEVSARGSASGALRSAFDFLPAGARPVQGAVLLAEANSSFDFAALDPLMSEFAAKLPSGAVSYGDFSFSDELADGEVKTTLFVFAGERESVAKRVVRI